MPRISGRRLLPKMFQQQVRNAPTGSAASDQVLSKSEKCAVLPRYCQMFLLSDQDLYLFNEGSHTKLYERLGSHIRTVDGVKGVNFAVWAPDAETVSVKGGFNDWSNHSHQLYPSGQSGIRQRLTPHIGHAEPYKYPV